MTLRLSAQAGVLRGEQQKKRGEQKEKKNKVHLRFCAFLSRRILLLSPLVLSFFPRRLAFLSHSFTSTPFSCLSVLRSVLPFLTLPRTHFPSLSFVPPYSSSRAIQRCLMRSCLSHNVSFFLCGAVTAIAHSQQDCWRD